MTYLKKGLSVEDSLKVLEKTIRTIRNNELLSLEKISNELTHSSTTFQDSISISISKIIFGIFKLERIGIQKNVPLPLSTFINHLTKMHDFLLRGKIKEFESESNDIIKLIIKNGEELKIGNVIERAGVKKGSRLYDHGMSVALAADSMNVSQWELYDYIGKSSMNDYPEDVDTRTKIRLKYAREVFR
ncbi:MAG: hypothetical protein ACQER9_00220 [Nanobdellota archaeon]